jgi:enoyl-CoA hydratase/carnithine racemase
MACEFRVAGRLARCGTGFAGIGYSGDFGGSWSLTRLVETPKARELDFFGAIIDGAAAASLGLVKRVMEDDALPFRGQNSDLQQSSRLMTVTMGESTARSRQNPGALGDCQRQHGLQVTTKLDRRTRNSPLWRTQGRLTSPPSKRQRPVWTSTEG